MKWLLLVYVLSTHTLGYMTTDSLAECQRIEQHLTKVAVYKQPQGIKTVCVESNHGLFNLDAFIGH